MVRRVIAAAGLAIALMAPAAANATTPVAGNLRVAIDSNAEISNYDQTAARNQYVILHAWQQDRMRALKERNPNLKVLVYKNLTSTRYEPSWDGPLSRGVDYDYANQHHPEWFLKNTSGQRVVTNGYGTYVMDVGSRSYQDEWAKNVVSELKSEGWDGVFMDDTNLTMRYHYDPSKIAKYPSDAEWQRATESMLGNVGPKILAAGKLAIPNIGSWTMYPAVGDRWLQHVSGGMDEMFTKWESPPGEGYRWEGGWETHLASLKKAQAAGKIYLGVSHSDASDGDAARYGWATMLLGADGKAAFAMHADYTNETWFPEYDYPIGVPSGPSSREDNGVHRREFSNGLVLVNPTDSWKTVAFGGTYRGSGLSDRTSAGMAPHSALVLVESRGDASQPPNDSDPPRPARPSRPVSLDGTPIGKGYRFRLRWQRPRRNGTDVRYQVFRNGNRIARGREYARFMDRRVRRSQRRVYRVRAVTRRGVTSRFSAPVVYHRRR